MTNSSADRTPTAHRDGDIIMALARAALPTPAGPPIGTLLRRALLSSTDEPNPPTGLPVYRREVLREGLPRSFDLLGGPVARRAMEQANAEPVTPVAATHDHPRATRPEATRDSDRGGEPT